MGERSKLKVIVHKPVAMYTKFFNPYLQVGMTDSEIDKDRNDNLYFLEPISGQGSNFKVKGHWTLGKFAISSHNFRLGGSMVMYM